MAIWKTFQRGFSHTFSSKLFTLTRMKSRLSKRNKTIHYRQRGNFPNVVTEISSLFSENRPYKKPRYPSKNLRVSLNQNLVNMLSWVNHFSFNLTEIGWNHTKPHGMLHMTTLQSESWPYKKCFTTRRDNSKSYLMSRSWPRNAMTSYWTLHQNDQEFSKERGRSTGWHCLIVLNL